MPYLRAVLGLCSAAWICACFDSDEKYELVAGTTTGTTGPTTGDDTTTTTSTSSTGEVPPGTCRDAIVCIQQCTIEIIIEMDPEPDLSCLVDCVEDSLSVDEARKLLELTNCVSGLCEGEMSCDPGGTSSGGSSSSGGTSSGGSSSSGGTSTSSATDDTAEPPLLGPCLTCIFDKLPRSADDPELEGCTDLAMECK